MTIAAALTSKADTGQRWADHAHAVIRAAGHRSSAPRSAVVQTLAAQSCVRSAREIGDSLRRDGSEIGIATLSPDPTLVCMQRRAVGHRAFGAAPSLLEIDVEVGKSE